MNTYIHYGLYIGKSEQKFGTTLLYKIYVSYRIHRITHLALWHLVIVGCPQYINDCAGELLDMDLGLVFALCRPAIPGNVSCSLYESNETIRSEATTTTNVTRNSQGTWYQPGTW